MKIILPRDRSQGQTSLPEAVELTSFRDFYAFEQHVATCRGFRGLDMIPEWYEIPAFYFSNANALIGDGDSVFAPAGCDELDYELELGIVISKPGRDISVENAWDHVLGFTIVNDFSARDLQRREMKIGLGPAKGKDFATSVGPGVVPLAELQDRIDSQGRISLEMKASVNGKVLSTGNANQMHHTWPTLIAHASRDVELVPGELLGSGTVGTGCILELRPENTGGWLKPGDTVELEVEAIGRLSNPIVARPSS